MSKIRLHLSGNQCSGRVGLLSETSVSILQNIWINAIYCDHDVNPGFGGQAFMPEDVRKSDLHAHICNKLSIRLGGKVASLPLMQKHFPVFDGGMTADHP